MKTIYHEFADDGEQANVIVRKATLVQVEKLLTSAGLDESTMNDIAHHLLVGGLAYLVSAPVSALKVADVKTFVRKHKSVLKMLAKNITRTSEELAPAEKVPV